MHRAPRILHVAVASCLAACGGSHGTTNVATSPTMAANLPTLEGRAVLDVPIEQASPAARDLWERLHALEVITPPSPLEHASLEAERDWMQSQLVPWLRTATERLRALQPSMHALANSSAEEQLFAAIVSTAAYEHVVRFVGSIPPPTVAEHQADIDAAWHDSIDGVLAPYYRFEVDAYGRCAQVAPRVPEAMRGWGEVCTTRGQAIEQRLAAASSRRPSGTASGPPARHVPSECQGPLASVVDPEAPPPDEHAPRDVAVIIEDDRFHANERTQLATAVLARLRQRHVTHLVPLADIAHAEALRASRRWTDRGPVCGQQPPLPAVIAARHRNLVIASVSTMCERQHPSSAPASPAPNGETETCTLDVTFRRAGSTDTTGLPEPLTASANGDATAIATWTAAATRLDVVREGTAYGYGGLGMAGGGYYRVLGYETTDPWLRVGLTLDGSDIEHAMLACHAARDVASYRVRWTISPTGTVSDASAESVTAAGDQTAAERECIARALSTAAFPCTRDGRPAQVEALVCVGH